MKKLFMCLAFWGVAMCGFSQNYNAAQEELRKEVSAFLIRKGFNPENQDDGLIFKSEGLKYCVEIDETEKNPMYICLRLYFNYSDKYDKDFVTRNLNDYNVKYGVKVYCLENSFVLSAEMFVTKAYEFNYAFDTMLDHIKSAKDLIIE